MRNLLPQKEHYYKSFASAMEKKFMQVRFGLKSCTVEQDLWLAELRKELVDWQQNEDHDALTQVGVQFYTGLNVNFDGNQPDVDFNVNGGGGSIISGPGCEARSQTLKINYNYAGGSANIVDVNTAGCVTRINLNPTINIDGGRYVFTQATAATTWIINHQLGFTPNVFAEDDMGTDIQGVITIIDNNTLHIDFSSPVAGKAYLS